VNGGTGPSGQLGTAGAVLSWHAQQEAEASGKQAGPPVEDTRDHTTEVLAAHGGQPTMAVQSQTHGAACPPADHGVPDRQKYGG
jgi:hypothetical protein